MHFKYLKAFIVALIVTLFFPVLVSCSSNDKRAEDATGRTSRVESDANASGTMASIDSDDYLDRSRRQMTTDSDFDRTPASIEGDGYIDSDMDREPASVDIVEEVDVMENDEMATPIDSTDQASAFSMYQANAMILWTLVAIAALTLIFLAYRNYRNRRAPRV